MSVFSRDRISTCEHYYHIADSVLIRSAQMVKLTC